MSSWIFSLGRRLSRPLISLLIVLIVGDVTSEAVEANPKAPAASSGTPLVHNARIPWQDELETDLAYLCSDELRGRSVVDDSIHIAADYISGRFRAIGLQTTLISGGPLQEVETFVGSEVGADGHNRLEFRSDSNPMAPDAQTPLELISRVGVSMNPLAIGASKANVSGRVVFAGYGITAPEFDYDDYANIDVDGAIVVVLRKEPRNSDPTSRFNGKQTTSHAYFSTKVANAMRHGAAGLIVVNDRASVAESLAKIEETIRREQNRKLQLQERIREATRGRDESRETLNQNLAGIESVLTGYRFDLERANDGLLGISEAGDRPDSATTIPVICIARPTIDELLRSQTLLRIDDLERQLDSQQMPSSFELRGIHAEMEVELQSNKRLSNNVLGVLPGRGVLAEETVIIGAHYDHVGMGGVGSLAPGTVAIHNGADDNASGVSTLIAAATLLKERLKSFDTHRRVLFVAFTAEERGLLGSAHYVRQPRYPISTTVAMINLDMVGRLRDNELTVYGTGSGDTLDQVVEQVNFKHQFNLFKVASGYGPSDHQSFYEAGVPVLFFFTGLHSDYHRPSDDLDKINFDGVFRITEMVCDVATQLSIAASRPKRFETEKGVRIRRQLTAVLGVTLATLGDRVSLSGISEGGAAALGGLQIGDQIEHLGKTAVRSSSDVIEILRGHSPGDSLDVTLVRQGQRLQRRVRLQARGGN